MKNFKGSMMKLNWNFQGGGMVQTKNHPRGKYGYFLEPHIQYSSFSYLKSPYFVQKAHNGFHHFPALKL